MTRYMSDPSGNGLNLETVEGAKDSAIKSLRVDQGYRAIAFEVGRDTMFVHVNEHDKAYRWASGRRIKLDPDTNRIRVMNTNDAGVLMLGGLAVDAGTIDTLAGVGLIAEEDASTTDNGTEGFNGENRHGRGTVLDLPAAVQVVDDRLFVIDSDNHRVRVFDEFGTSHILAGSTDVPTDARTAGTAATQVGDDAAALDADLNHPSGLFVTATPDGYTIDVADSGNHRVRRLDTVVLTDGPKIDEN
jgi:hypothetical protein